MAEKKENKKSAAVEMYFSRNQTNGLMYVLDCFVKADKTNKYGKYAEALKKAITNYSRIFVSDGEEMIAFHLFNKEAATIIKLFSIYIAAVQEMPEQYFDKIIETIMNRSDENE
ncbi:hypothetical protein [Ruminococcus sp. XPD3002]|uniref:hypothetical protein n=1 Tax=Ruminococcus sp. XPD3002 TaxID=1452269 RepID=UPI00091B4CC7|nr:hypothetical protein SAMN04487832_105170 [Ruminococcus flavefaciens]